MTFIDNPDQIDDCGGENGGCEHMEAERARRIARARGIHEDEQRSANQMTPAQAYEHVRRLGESFGLVMRDIEGQLVAEPIQGAADIKNKRARIVRNEGEQD